MPLEPPVTSTCAPRELRHAAMLSRLGRSGTVRSVPRRLLSLLRAARGAPPRRSPAPGFGRRAQTSTGAPVAQGSVEQVAVTGAGPRATARLLDAAGDEVASATHRPRRDRVLFRDVAPGAGYVVDVVGIPERPGHGQLGRRRAPPRRSTPPAARRGLRLPPHARRHAAVGQRDAARPGRPAAPTPPSSSTRATTRRTPTPAHRRRRSRGCFGYATVGVNLRGTGCSGGAWDYFEPLQSLDGYDVIETVAAQPWVAHGKVGMVGISFSGITQLFVAAHPPAAPRRHHPAVGDRRHLRHAVPGRRSSTTGSALRWAKDRAGRRPSTRGRSRAGCASASRDGDETCEANQALRLQTRDVLDADRVLRVPATRPAATRIAPETFVDRIDGAGVHRRLVAGRGDRRALRQHARPTSRPACR